MIAKQTVLAAAYDLGDTRSEANHAAVAAIGAAYYAAAAFAGCAGSGCEPESFEAAWRGAADRVGTYTVNLANSRPSANAALTLANELGLLGAYAAAAEAYLDAEDIGNAWASRACGAAYQAAATALPSAYAAAAAAGA